LAYLASKNSKQKNVPQPPTAKSLRIVVAPSDQLPVQREAALSDKQFAALPPIVKQLTEKVRKAKHWRQGLMSDGLIRNGGQS
jgi:hypothetical protein